MEEETKLPIGVQSFRKIRQRGLRYVDKSSFASRLIRGGQNYFLSRPRRFGKSLFVHTIKELFEGNERLFRGLAIHGDWDWCTRYPVIHLSFGKGNFSNEGELKLRISELLGRIERAAGLPFNATTSSGRFGELIFGLHEKFGQPVVVLVDEYDKPILDAVQNPEVALKNRQTLQGFYSTLKDEDGYIRFCFVTGVSRFAHVSLFSGANNLEDITLVPEFSSICGYTESDLDEVFPEDVAGLDREKIRKWYNGYCWLGEERVYNPYGMLLLLKQRTFLARWYETGAPAFLIDAMKRRGVLPMMLEDMMVSSSDLLVSDLDKVSAESLLLQTGYMTIAESMVREGMPHYKLDYPNREVRQAFNASMLSELLQQMPSVVNSRRERLARVLETGDADGMESAVHSMFSGIPHQWHAIPGVENYEAYFASVVYGYFFGSEFDVRMEDSTSKGRVDLTVLTPANIYLFEFKVVKDRPSGKAMKQLKEKNYADKYRQHGIPIRLVAVEFSKTTKNIASFGSELA